MKATVLLSGGQDSTTCLYWALREFDEVDAVSFDYGQRHIEELSAAMEIAHEAGIQRTIYSIPTLTEMQDSALVDHEQDIMQIAEHSQLPASFTPGRNDLFLTVAAMHAYKHQRTGQLHLVAGVCQTDYSGYPDCRSEFIAAKAKSVALALDRAVEIHTPLMWLSKADTVELARSLGSKCWDALRLTVTCYLGQRPGCGTCPACVLRAKGFSEMHLSDPAMMSV